MIKYVVGNATEPELDPLDLGRLRLIVHVCNDAGAWGAGFVMALSEKWSIPEQSYRNWFEHNQDLLQHDKVPFGLGEVQLCQVEADILVANMIAQKHIRRHYGDRPLNYGALAECLGKVYRSAEVAGMTVHMPKIGSGLAGGSWEVIAEMIEFLSNKYQVDTTVYTLPA